MLCSDTKKASLEFRASKFKYGSFEAYIHAPIGISAKHPLLIGAALLEATAFINIGTRMGANTSFMEESIVTYR